MFDTLARVAKKIFGDANERELRRLQPLVSRINDLEPAMVSLGDAELAARTPMLREKLANGASLDDLLPEAFATVREASKRSLGMRPYDCQLIGGIVLHKGRIAEMRTGEGKTLVATLPVYLNALAGKGVHVVTVNDYLAERDANWMKRVYSFLGMTTGVILSNERNESIKRAAYACDITYGTNNEFGFDYLRDNMKYSLDDMVQRGHTYAIVDEVDSILIDEARTPLIISGPTNAGIEMYQVVDAVIPLLQHEIDFVIDEKARSVSLTDEGISNVERKLGIDNLYDPRNMEALHHVGQSLKAHHVFRRDKDYVVRDGKVTIVDEFTGRLMTGRRWSDGLHQAVEAKERVNIEQESQTYATITFQNLFRMYEKLAGMTGTAATEAGEFATIYNLDVVVIPTNRSIARKDVDDIIYKTQMEKFEAVVEEITKCNQRGQPVLVGTTSVEKSEIVSRLLTRAEVPHEVLNAKNHSREATIIANAGRRGAVTISTNMAGRGTDIRLGGNAEAIATISFDGQPAPDPEAFAAAVVHHEAASAAEAEEVKAVGGLHIIGTERHESRRVDNQLRGRAGRQGDPGSSRFYLCLEDDLLRLFGSDKITVWMERMGLKDDEPIEHRWITSSVENAQRKVEGHNFNQRKNLLEYDDVMNYHRKAVYELRKRALANQGIRKLVDDAVESVVQDISDDFLADTRSEGWNITGLRENIQRVFSLQWPESDIELRDMSREELRQRVRDGARERLEARIAEVGEEEFIEYTRMSVLRSTDDLWKDQLLALDRLRQGVGLRGYGQRNPLLEYKREALQMFLMMSAARDEALLADILHQAPDLMKAAAAVSG
ncbi:MAG: preprotein translocase subunit SecA, partial [Deltaproteobacteria bacterium]|nr:preprotein translocase subunit SecA [Deltaproteobacteria bacterium]